MSDPEPTNQQLAKFLKYVAKQEPNTLIHWLETDPAFKAEMLKKHISFQEEGLKRIRVRRMMRGER